MRFTGIYYTKIDVKGRFSIPAAFRHHETKGEIQFLTHPELNVLIGYSEPILDEAVSSLSAIFSKAVNYDKDGRSVLPIDFRKFLGLNGTSDNIAVVGMGNHFQIWTKDDWKKVEPEYKLRLIKALVGKSIWVPSSSDITS